MRLSPAHTVHRSAFTLIEILVVVAIIALLIAILLPSLKNAKEMGRATVCGTHMQQIFDASLMYAHGNSDRLPDFGGWWSFAMGNAEPQWWPTQIARMIGNDFAVFRCPSDKYPCPVPVKWVRGSIRMALPLVANSVQLDITYRSSCDSMEDVNGTYRPRKISSWRYPGRSILMVEADVQDPTLTSPHDCFRLYDNLYKLDDSRVNVDALIRAYWLTPSAQEWKRHVGKTNFLFMDSHVQRMTPRQAARLAWSQEHYLDPSNIPANPYH